MLQFSSQRLSLSAQPLVCLLAVMALVLLVEFGLPSAGSSSSSSSSSHRHLMAVLAAQQANSSAVVGKPEALPQPQQQQQQQTLRAGAAHLTGGGGGNNTKSAHTSQSSSTQGQGRPPRVGRVLGQDPTKKERPILTPQLFPLKGSWHVNTLWPVHVNTPWPVQTLVQKGLPRKGSRHSARLHHPILVSFADN